MKIWDKCDGDVVPNCPVGAGGESNGRRGPDCDFECAGE